MKLDINDNGEFYINGVQFVIDMGWGGKRAKSEENRFTIVKNKPFFDFYESLVAKAPKNIFEVGFFEGGSSVFFREYFQPDQMTAVDRRAEKIAPVEKYIDGQGVRDKFRLVYGFDQSDQAGLKRLVDQHHGGTLDLVIDDASHQYELTKKTFGALFPRVVPGGTYIIEDYGWAHDKRYQESDHPWAKNPSLANLIFQLTTLVESAPDLIERIELRRALAIITKGPGPVSSQTLNIDERMLLRGRPFNLI